MNCIRCVYSTQAPIDPSNIGGERPMACLRYPPAVFPIQTSRGISSVCLRPMVQPTDTCGEFVLKALA